MAEDVLERPLCKCHGEPMVKNGAATGRQTWRCAEGRRRAWASHYARNGEKERERGRKNYDELTGLQYNHLLLRRRRVKALARIAERTRG